MQRTSSGLVLMLEIVIINLSMTLIESLSGRKKEAMLIIVGAIGIHRA